MLDARFRRLWDADRLPSVDDFDPANDLHLEELAGVLLDRFARERDAEAFTLLFELTRARLERMAARLALRLSSEGGAGSAGGGLASHRLVLAVMRRAWRELAGRPAPAGFLVMARGWMEREMRRAEAPFSRVLRKS